MGILLIIVIIFQIHLRPTLELFSCCILLYITLHAYFLHCWQLHNMKSVVGLSNSNISCQSKYIQIDSFCKYLQEIDFLSSTWLLLQLITENQLDVADDSCLKCICITFFFWVSYQQRSSMAFASSKHLCCPSIRWRQEKEQEKYGIHQSLGDGTHKLDNR